MTFSDERPDADVTAFHRRRVRTSRFDDVIDVADASNRYAPIAPPRRWPGWPSPATPTSVRSASTARGVTQLIAIPLWDRAAEPLREQLAETPGVELIDEGDILQVGPLSVLLTELRYGGGWLIAGTVTPGHSDHRPLASSTHGARYVDR